VMKDAIQELFDASEKMNGSAMSLIRCLILVILNYYRDGLQFRELKAAFGISDGRLASNLNKMEEFGYLEKSSVEFDNKTLTVYYLTPEGVNEVKKMGLWMESILRIINGGQGS